MESLTQTNFHIKIHQNTKSQLPNSPVFVGCFTHFKLLSYPRPTQSQDLGKPVNRQFSMQGALPPRMIEVVIRRATPDQIKLDIWTILDIGNTRHRVLFEYPFFTAIHLWRFQFHQYVDLQLLITEACIAWWKSGLQIAAGHNGKMSWLKLTVAG